VRPCACGSTQTDAEPLSTPALTLFVFRSERGEARAMPGTSRLEARRRLLHRIAVARSGCFPQMTGRLPIRSGTAGPYTPGAPPYNYDRSNGVFSCDSEFGLPLNETTVAEVLKGAGYKTGMAGKCEFVAVASMSRLASAPSLARHPPATRAAPPPPRPAGHLGQREQYLPNNRGFDKYFGIPYSDDMGANWWQGRYHEERGCSPLPVFNNTGNGSYNVQEQPACFDTLAERYATFAEDFIAESAGSPFLLYMAMSHVHTAVAADPQWAGPQFWNTSARGPFGDAAAEMDWVAGRILESLAQHGLDDDTVVFFSSDNGPWVSHTASRMAQMSSCPRLRPPPLPASAFHRQARRAHYPTLPPLAADQAARRRLVWRVPGRLRVGELWIHRHGQGLDVGR